MPVPPPFATVDGWGPRLSAATSPGSGKRCDPPRPSAALWRLLVGWPIPTHPSAWTPATLRTQPSRPPRIAAPGPASPGASVACMKDQVPAPDHGARGAWVTKTSLPSTGKARRPAHAPSSRLVRRPRRRLQFWQVFSDQAFCGSFLSGAPWSLPPSEQEQAALAPAHDIGKARAEARAKRPKPSRKRRAKPVAKSTLSTAPTSHSFPGISRRVCAQTGHASPETKPWQAAMEAGFRRGGAERLRPRGHDRPVQYAGLPARIAIACSPRGDTRPACWATANRGSSIPPTSSRRQRGRAAHPGDGLQTCRCRGSALPSTI